MSALAGLTTAGEEPSTPVVAVLKADRAALFDALPGCGEWIAATGFEAEPGQICRLPDDRGRPGTVLVGIGDADSRWDWAGLPASLQSGTFHLDGAPSPARATAAALGWALGTYRFSRYRSRDDSRFASLIWPDACERAHVEQAAEATFLARDLINTPAADMGPAELAAAVEAVARACGAWSGVIVGDDLLSHGYPAVHCVGRASARPPRLIDLRWGEESHPKLTLVGKGVCFDSGGLDIKPAAGMKLMKKDMGGAAIMLALAQMVMRAQLPVRLRLLIPAVENSISGDAMRPLDVVRTRKGLSVEIGNTDAEGRVILADALAEAAGERPDLLLDFATLTGAARVALGTEIPALFSNDDALAASLLAAAAACGDPLWRLPLWPSYRRHLKSKTADLTNAPDSPFAGAILAALFLAEFVDPPCPWAHADVMAWNTETRPGRPEGGEAMGLLACFEAIRNRFAG